MTNDSTQEPKPQHGKCHDKDITIVVNGVEHDVRKKRITFEELVALAYPNPPTGPDVVYSITFSGARGNKPEGILSPGEELKIKQGTVIDVVCTNRS